jgi:GDPmannose 4,6-dehydratase
MKTALITGITGQDGAYLCSLLLNKGYRVFGAVRRTSSVNFWRLEELGVLNHHNFSAIDYDITDCGAAFRVLGKCMPDEIYNLAAQSFVATSFEQPHMTANITGLGTLNLLEAMRVVCPKSKFYQASTSEMFGKVQATPQTEDTPFYPRSPYGVAKLYAHWIAINYRESYNIFASCGILFNHESPLRGREFVTRKISDTLAKIRLGGESPLVLGNLDAVRDWGYAPEYVEGMWRMLQLDTPNTYILATSRTSTVREFAVLAANALGFDLAFEGSGLDEVGYDARSGRQIVKVSAAYHRPAEVDLLVGDASKAKLDLDWEARTPLAAICEMMVSSDLRRNRDQKSF